MLIRLITVVLMLATLSAASCNILRPSGAQSSSQGRPSSDVADMAVEAF